MKPRFYHSQFAINMQFDFSSSKYISFLQIFIGGALVVMGGTYSLYKLTFTFVFTPKTDISISPFYMLDSKACPFSRLVKSHAPS